MVEVAVEVAAGVGAQAAGAAGVASPHTGGCRANECARLQIGAVVPLLGHMIVCLPLTRSSPQRRVLAAIDKKEASW